MPEQREREPISADREIPFDRLCPWAMGRKSQTAVKMIQKTRAEYFFEAIASAGVSEKEALQYAGIDAVTWARFYRVAQRCGEALRDGWSERGSAAEMLEAARRVCVPVGGDEGPADLRPLLAQPEEYAVFWRRFMATRVEGEVSAAKNIYKLAVGGEFVIDSKTGDRKFRPLETRTEMIDYELSKPLPGTGATGRQQTYHSPTWRAHRRRVTVTTHPPNLNALVFILLQRHQERWNKRKGGAGDKQAFEHAAEIMAAIQAANDSVPIDILGSDDPDVKIKTPGRK